MSASLVRSKWNGGNLEFYQSTAANSAGIRFGNSANGDDFQLIFADDGTVFCDTSTAVSGSVDGTHGFLTIKVGSATRYIKLYDCAS